MTLIDAVTTLFAAGVEVVVEEGAEKTLVEVVVAEERPNRIREHTWADSGPQPVHAAP